MKEANRYFLEKDKKKGVAQVDRRLGSTGMKKEKKK